MIKKIFVISLVLTVLNMYYMPVLANQDRVDNPVPVSFVTDLNVNKSSKGQIVQFITTEDFVDKCGTSVPKGTVLNGKIKSIKHSRWAFRRAKAHIIVKEMVLPNGQKYRVRAFTKPRVLKGSAIGNVGKGIIMTPVALVTIVGGGVIMLCEAITIVGLVAVPPTGYAVCELVGKETNGVNCCVPQGKNIYLKIKSCPPLKYSNPEQQVNQTPENEDND